MTARKRSWWETTQTPAYGFSLGALWVFMAAFQWIELATGDEDRAWRIVTGVVATLAAILYLAPAAVQLRRKRRDTA